MHLWQVLIGYAQQKNLDKTFMDIVWNDVDLKKELDTLGVSSVADFWWIEDRVDGKASTSLCREHVDRKSGEVDRKTAMVRVQDDTFFLKRFSGKSYENAMGEYDAISLVPRFGVKTADVAAYYLNPDERKGFILMRDLKRFWSLEQFVRRKGCSDDEVERLRESGRVLLDKLMRAFHHMQEAGYSYPDWRDKHIMFDVLDMEIALIDLERFKHCSTYPWFDRWGIGKRRRIKKERQALFSSLESEFFSKADIRQAYEDAK